MLFPSSNTNSSFCLILMNGYEDTDRNIFFKLREDNITREHGVVLATEVPVLKLESTE